MEAEQSHNSVHDQLEQISKSLESIGERFAPLRNFYDLRMQLGESMTENPSAEIKAEEKTEYGLMENLDSLLLETFSMAAETSTERMDEMFIALHELDQTIKDFKAVISSIKPDAISEDSSQ